MLETTHSSRIFRGVHFALYGFDPHTESQIRFKLVNGGGIDVGKNSGSCTHVIVDKIAYVRKFNYLFLCLIGFCMY